MPDLRHRCPDAPGRVRPLGELLALPGLRCRDALGPDVAPRREPMTDWFVRPHDGLDDGDEEWLDTLERGLEQLMEDLEAEILGDEEAG